MTDIYCVTHGCRNNLKRVVIGRTNGSVAEVYCAECRKWTYWGTRGLLAIRSEPSILIRK